MNAHNIEIGYIGGKKEEEKSNFVILEPKDVESYIANADLKI
jgi:hypothetical protein